MWSLRLEGAAQLAAKLGQIERELPAALGRGLYQGGEKITTSAKRDSPFDIGTLRGSHHTVPPVVSGSGATVVVGAGGPAAPYAGPLHEGHRLVAWGHDTGRFVAGRKWFEGAALAEWPGVPELVAGEVRRVLR